MWTWLERVNPEEHANRWYAVGVQPGLFDDVVVARFWGNRSTRYQQARFEPFNGQATARAAADRLIREKLRGGYRIVSGYVPPAED